ncbi:MAG: ThiF family adenylyltransferase [Acidobacteriota bacterium]|nr:ThiF family adenylyltransferase [Acidobacteriota bacterium]
MAHVILIGAGAIGSQVLQHLARSPHVSKITLIDPGRYDTGNTRGQHIDLHDVGRSKARAQARRLRRITPALPVVPIRAAVGRLPLGMLRGSVILAALDSRRARMTVNQAAWRLGVPWIDSGVHADGMLARVRVFVPGDDAPCLECGWDQADYDALEQVYPCAPGVIPGSTGASPALSGVAAAFEAIECDKLLGGEAAHALVGRDVLIDTRHHIHSVTGYRRNPSCRMPDHGGWQITALDAAPDSMTVDHLLALGSTLRGARASLALRIAGRRLATELRCEACDAPHAICQTERLTRRSRLRCRQCAAHLRLTGFGLHDFVSETAVPVSVREQPLSAIGVRAHDVITLRTPELDAHFEVGAP